MARRVVGGSGPTVETPQTAPSGEDALSPSPMMASGSTASEPHTAGNLHKGRIHHGVWIPVKLFATFWAYLRASCAPTNTAPCSYYVFYNEHTRVLLFLNRVRHRLEINIMKGKL